LVLIPVTLMGGSTYSLQVAIGMSGVWWAVFTVPAGLLLAGRGSWWPIGRDKTTRQGAGEEEDGLLAVHTEDSSTAAPHETRVWSEVKGAWRKLGQMVRPSEILKLRSTFTFLAAWFLLSDGFTTITSTALLFAKMSLHMSATSLVFIGVISPLAGIVGALVWPRLQRRLRWTALHALIVLVLMAAVIPLYGCLGFIPAFAKGSIKFGGLTTQGEMWVLAVYFGFAYGAFQGYARSVFAELIPPGEEARWYGLYSITDKSSSFLGPLVVGLIADATGNIRFAFFFLFFMIFVPVPILLFGVDTVKGREDAMRYTEEKLRLR